VNTSYSSEETDCANVIPPIGVVLEILCP